MRQIPVISTDCDDVVVDEVVHRRPLLGLLGREHWRVIWRSVRDPELRGSTVITVRDDAGTARLGLDQFDFVVRWREDRRRGIRVFAGDDFLPEPSRRPTIAVSGASLPGVVS